MPVWILLLACLRQAHGYFSSSSPTAPSHNSGLALSRVFRAAVHVRMSSEGDIAREAGASAARNAAAAASQTTKRGPTRDNGKAFTAVLSSKPLGLILAQNPSGRGIFVSEVMPLSAADTCGSIKPGDFVTEVFGSGSRDVYETSWSTLDDVLAVVEAASPPLGTMQRQRGGGSAWHAPAARVAL